MKRHHILLLFIALAGASMTKAWAQDPVGWWQLNGDLQDRSASAQHATISGTEIYGTGPDGSSQALETYPAYAILPSSTSLDITGSMSISIWWQGQSNNSSAHSAIGRMGNSSNRGWAFGPNNAGDVNFSIAATSSSIAMVSAIDVNVGNSWAHWVAVYDASAQTMRIYKDGVMVAENNSSIPASQYINTATIKIGQRGDGFCSLDGLIDNVRIYDRALSSQEIADIHSLEQSTCYNGVQDGDEQGIDCGGSCTACDGGGSGGGTTTVWSLASGDGLDGPIYRNGPVGINTDQITEALLNIKGISSLEGTKSLAVRNADGLPLLLTRDDQKVLVGTETPSVHGGKLHVQDRLTILSGATKGDLAIIGPENNKWGTVAMHNDRFRLKSTHPISIGSNQTQDALNILTDGSIGISTATVPQGHMLAVNGTVKAHEVEVSLSGWSDYVLQPDYDLPTLSDVREYIKAYGHLPGVPSEAEVLEKGIQVGDMNKLLLAKIEELTLYLLQQDETIERLKGLYNSIPALHGYPNSPHHNAKIPNSSFVIPNSPECSQLNIQNSALKILRLLMQQNEAMAEQQKEIEILKKKIKKLDH